MMLQNSFQEIKYLNIFNSKVKYMMESQLQGLYVNLQNVLDILYSNCMDIILFWSGIICVFLF